MGQAGRGVSSVLCTSSPAPGVSFNGLETRKLLWLCSAPGWFQRRFDTPAWVAFPGHPCCAGAGSNQAESKRASLGKLSCNPKFIIYDEVNSQLLMIVNVFGDAHEYALPLGGAKGKGGE